MTITGEVIKKIREILKWTQQQMGDAIESSRELVNKMESKNLPISKARKILIEKLVKDYKLESEIFSLEEVANDNTQHVSESIYPYKKPETNPVDQSALNSLLRILESQQSLLDHQHRTIDKQQETIHYLTTGKSQGGGNALSKKALG